MGNITIGVTGRGETSLRNATALIGDYANAHQDDVIAFAIDLSVDEAGDLPRGVQAAATFAIKHGLEVEAVVPQGQKDPGDNEQFAAVLEAAKTVIKVANPTVGVVRRSTAVFVAWEEEEEDGALAPTVASIKALEAAERFSVPAYDLTDGLLPLAFEGEEDQAEEAPTPPPDEPTSTVQPEKPDTPDSDKPLTLGHDIVEHIAAAVAAAVLAEITPLIEQIAKQTAPRPRGRPRKATEED